MVPPAGSACPSPLRIRAATAARWAPLLALAIGPLLLPAAPVAGQDTPSALSVVHEVPMGTLNAVELSAQQVFVGVGPRLAILDASEPQSPRLIGFTGVLGDAVRAIAADPAAADRVFVAAGRSGTVVFDVAEPSSPTEVLRLEGRSVGVQVTDGYVYVLGDALAIHARAPDGLREVGRIELPIEGFHVVDDIAWLATGAGGVVAYDLTDPSRPAPIGALDTVGDSHDVRVEGPFAYVADGGLRLSVLDVRAPATPTLAAEYLLDVSDEPECPASGSNCGLDVRRVRLAGDRLVLSAFRTLGAFSGRTRPRVELLAVSPSGVPSRLGLVKLGGNPVAIAADEARVVVANHPLWWYAGVSPCHLVPGGLGLYDADLAPVGAFGAPAGANAVALFQDKVWLADVTRGVRAYDLAGADAPREVATSFRTYGSSYGSPEARDLVVDERGARLAVGGQTAGFLASAVQAAAALSEPGRPCNGCAPPPRDQWYARIASDGDRDFLLDLDAGLQVYGLGEGASSGRLAPVAATDLAAKDGSAYLVGADGLTVVDATDPASPARAGALRLTGHGNAVAVSAGAGLVAMVGPQGLALVDVRTAAPVVLATAATPSEARGVALYGHTAYVAAPDGLLAYDVADPEAPTEIARAEGLAAAHAVATDGAHVAVLASGGLFVFDAVPDDGSPPRLPDATEPRFAIHLPFLARMGG